MKKIIALFITAALAVSMTACNNKNATQADMDKLKGETLSSVSETSTNTDGEKTDKAEAQIGNFEVAIEDAKLIAGEDGQSNIIVISYRFKNKTDHEKSFDGIFAESVTQQGHDLTGAPPVAADGFDPLSATTLIGKGDTAIAQKAYKLRDNETDVTVSVYKYGEPETGMITKTFSIAQ